MKRSFQSYNIQGQITDKKLPILLICNHISWWDGIWALYVNQHIFNRKYHFMMLEKELRKNWFFQYTGGFSVNKNSKSILETLIYSAELLSNPQNLVLMFPQGGIKSMHHSSFTFEKGIQKILDKTNNEIQVVFQANLVDYFSDVKAHLSMYISNYNGSYNLNDIQYAYNEFYRQSVSNQIKKET